jgi:hypothetical protein
LNWSSAALEQVAEFDPVPNHLQLDCVFVCMVVSVSHKDELPGMYLPAGQRWQVALALPDFAVK